MAPRDPYLSKSLMGLDVSDSKSAGDLEQRVAACAKNSLSSFAFCRRNWRYSMLFLVSRDQA
jgi:hypothetical protein